MDEQQPQEMMPAVDIRYVGIGQLTLFLISEDELRMIESGGPSATYLNLAIGFLSVGGGTVGSLLLSGTPTASIYRFIIAVGIAIATLVAGFILLILWIRSSKDASNAIKRIRARAIQSAGAKVTEGPAEGQFNS